MNTIKKGPKTHIQNKEPKQGKLADKYKYVRFVEKKKVLRKMRSLQQALMNPNEIEEDRKTELESQLKDLRKDLMYVDKFPGNQKYISLFPSEGSLSEECTKKQQEIRNMIVRLTARSEAGGTGKRDVIKFDDFFASAGGVAKPQAVEKPAAVSNSKTGLSTQDKQKKSESFVHPAWEAKKMNEKLTGSIANQRFDGQRVVFEEED